MTIIKRNYRELTFSDDFMFCKVMSSHPELCKKVIEVCLGHPIGSLVSLRSQNVQQAVSDGRGVRLDIIAEDDDNRLMDVEMQKKNQHNIPERSRYYLGMMDVVSLKSGEDFRNLRDSYVIFITKFNLFPEKNLHRYTVRSGVIEYPEAEWNDRRSVIVLCANANDNNVPEKLKCFLDTAQIENIVEEARMNDDWFNEYAIYVDRIADERIEARQEGFEEGHAEGFEEGRAEGFEKGHAEGLTQGIAEGRAEGRAEELANTQRERQRAETAEKEVAMLRAELAALKK